MIISNLQHNDASFRIDITINRTIYFNGIFYVYLAQQVKLAIFLLLLVYVHITIIHLV